MRGNLEAPEQAALEAARLPALDMLRGVAICSVLLLHYVQETAPALRSAPWPLGHLLDLCWMGVDLFFVLSGFLLGGILMDNAAAPNLFKVFFARRTLRIFPLYFLSLLAFLLLQSTSWWRGNDAIAPFFRPAYPPWSYALFIQNFFMASTGTIGPQWMGVTWSLAVEEQFYLILPFLIRFVPRNRIPLLCIVCILGAPLARYLVSFVIGLPSPISPYVLLPCRMDTLFLGVLAAWMVRSPVVLERMRRQPAIFPIVATASACSMIGLFLTGWIGLEPGMFIAGYSIAALFFACIVLLAYRHPSTFAAFPGAALLRRMGLWCFSIYLFHQPILGMAHGLLFGRPPHVGTLAEAGVTLASLAASLVLAGLLWRFVERPLISIGHRFRYNTAYGRQPDAAAVQTLAG